MRYHPALLALLLAACETKATPRPMTSATAPSASTSAPPSASAAAPPAVTAPIATASAARPADGGPAAPLSADDAIARVFALPEVSAFGDAVRRASGGAASLSGWIESAPKPGPCARSSVCRYVIYLGEHHPDHMARWQTFFVERETGEVFIADLGGGEPAPYEVWRRRLRSTYQEFPEIRRLESLFPLHRAGRGALGYGGPEEVIRDLGAWKHAARAAFAAEGMTITRVELYQDRTYPVFFAKRGGEALSHLGERDPAAAEALARRLLAANAGWPYEIVEEGASAGERYRFRGTLKGGFSTLRGEAWSAE